MPNIFNISPRYPFLDVLATYVIETAKEKDLNIANDIILLPTRRACRHLKDLFFKLSHNDAVLLPTILPLGDIDENGIASLDYENKSLDESKLKPISQIERNLLLACLIEKASEDEISKEQAYSLAVDLAHLMDTVEMEKLSFNNIQNIFPEKYAVHWQKVISFLNIIKDNYPKILKENNLINPIERKVIHINKQIEYWKSFPPKGRIFAAGSTGSLIPIADMLRFIANMENGFLILPGLDKNLSDSDFNVLLQDYPNSHQNHPQYGLIKLIDSLHLKISDVEELPLYKDYDVIDADREFLATNIMLSWDMQEDWHKLPKLKQDILDNVSVLDLKTNTDEVLAIACLLRKCVAENKRGILITPDRKIAKSVSNELRRWNITVDDSAGCYASDTVTGNYIILILKLIYDNFSPYSLLAVLKHKYTHLGYDKAELDNLVLLLENQWLRNHFGLDSLDDIISLEDTILKENEDRINSISDEKLSPDKKIEKIKQFKKDVLSVKFLLNKISEITLEFQNLMNDSKQYHLFDLLEKHLQLVDTFVLSDSNDKNLLLWDSELHMNLSEELSSLLKSLKEIKEKDTSIDLFTTSAYFTFISNYLASDSLRQTTGVNPNIAIMNSIEARLMDADMFILAGLNEDTFPSLTAEDPWMSRPMKSEFKLPLPERKIGLSSHDFVEFFCKKNVVLTHAQKVDGANTVPSRWLTKFEAIREITKLPFKQQLAKEVLSWLNSFNTDMVAHLYPQPEPCPPVFARPTELSATWIEKWIRDPYIIFAAKILKLEKLKDINPVVGVAELGTLIHDSLEEFVKSDMQTAEELEKLMLKKSLPYKKLQQIDFWDAKFKVVASWFVKHKQSLKNLEKIITEVKGEYDFPELNKNFKMTAKADRFDLFTNGTACVYDYKTGTPPKTQDVKDGYSPQLPIEAIIFNRGGYKDAGVPEHFYINSLKYIKLTGSENGKETVFDSDIETLLNNTYSILVEMINSYYNNDNPSKYTSRPNQSKVGHSIEEYSEYTHLARVKEWQGN